jgi:hypothetical protein
LINKTKNIKAEKGSDPFSPFFNSQYIKQYLTGVEDGKRKTSKWFQSQGIFEKSGWSGGRSDGDSLYCAVFGIRSRRGCCAE